MLYAHKGQTLSWGGRWALSFLFKAKQELLQGLRGGGSIPDPENSSLKAEAFLCCAASPDHKGRDAEQSRNEVREWAGPRPESLCAVLKGGGRGLPHSDGATAGLEQGDIPTCVLGRLS